MKIMQLSVFLENRLGHLSHICKTLADAKINILTLTLADTSDYGILRLIVREWEKAKSVLEKANCIVNAVEVMAVEVPDQPGGIEPLLQLAENAGLGIEYMYAFAPKHSENAIIIIRFSDLQHAAEVFRDANINVLLVDDFYLNKGAK